MANTYTQNYVQIVFAAYGRYNFIWEDFKDNNDIAANAAFAVWEDSAATKISQLRCF